MPGRQTRRHNEWHNNQIYYQNDWWYGQSGVYSEPCITQNLDGTRSAMATARWNDSGVNVEAPDSTPEALIFTTDSMDTQPILAGRTEKILTIPAAKIEL